MGEEKTNAIFYLHCGVTPVLSIPQLIFNDNVNQKFVCLLKVLESSWPSSSSCG